MGPMRNPGASAKVKSEIWLRNTDMRPPLFCALILPVAAVLLPGSAATAQVYKVTDEDNGVVFTDRPDPAAGARVESIDIPESNRASPPPDIPRAPRAADRKADTAPAATVSITSPGDESTIAMGPGNFTVSAAARPPLGEGEELLLMMDGQPYGPAQASTTWFIEGAMRGPHDLVVQRRDQDGEALATSEPVRVYVLRPSVR